MRPIRQQTAASFHAQIGQVLRGRYRLEELLAQPGQAQTWRAFDTMLARSVIVHLLPSDRAHESLIVAAKKAALLADYRFLRVLDAAIADDSVDPGSAIGPYVVCEYAAGETLPEVLAAGPITTLEAAWLVREVAEALAGMHAHGLHHEHLTPDAVLLTTEGNVKIVTFRPDVQPAHGQQPVGDPEAADVQALGHLLSAALGSSGASPALSEICGRILTPHDHALPLRTAADLSAALAGVLAGAEASSIDAPTQIHAVESPTRAYAAALTPSQAVVGPTTRPQPIVTAAPVTPARRPRRPARWLRTVVPLVLIVLVGGLVVFGLRPFFSGDSATTGPSQQWPIVAAHDFDPEGNGEERPNQVPLAWDGNPETSWRTMNYWEADIGNKTGVGLVFDLGEVRQVSRVEIDLDNAGTSLEVGVPASEGVTAAPLTGIDQWRIAGRADHSPAETTVILDQPVQTRYVLIYLTELPPVGSAFTGGIAEARFWS